MIGLVHDLSLSNFGLRCARVRFQIQTGKKAKQYYGMYLGVGISSIGGAIHS